MTLTYLIDADFTGYGAALFAAERPTDAHLASSLILAHLAREKASRKEFCRKIGSSLQFARAFRMIFVFCPRARDVQGGSNENVASPWANFLMPKPLPWSWLKTLGMTAN